MQDMGDSLDVVAVADGQSQLNIFWTQENGLQCGVEVVRQGSTSPVFRLQSKFRMLSVDTTGQQLHPVLSVFFDEVLTE